MLPEIASPTDAPPACLMLTRCFSTRSSHAQRRSLVAAMSSKAPNWVSILPLLIPCRDLIMSATTSAKPRDRSPSLTWSGSASLAPPSLACLPPLLLHPLTCCNFIVAVSLLSQSLSALQVRGSPTSHLLVCMRRHVPASSRDGEFLVQPHEPPCIGGKQANKPDFPAGLMPVAAIVLKLYVSAFVYISLDTISTAAKRVISQKLTLVLHVAHVPADINATCHIFF